MILRVKSKLFLNCCHSVVATQSMIRSREVETSAAYVILMVHQPLNMRQLLDKIGGLETECKSKGTFPPLCKKLGDSPGKNLSHPFVF